jgi:hypothetical protein
MNGIDMEEKLKTAEEILDTVLKDEIIPQMDELTRIMVLLAMEQYAKQEVIRYNEEIKKILNK